MRKIIRSLLFGDKNRTNINSYQFNAAAGLINAGKSVLLLMIISRTNGLNDAGILTIAFAIANLMLFIGKFGMRSFQATDIDEKNGFTSYFYSRILSILVMLLFSGAWIIYGVCNNGYSLKKVLVIAFLCVIYASEAMEDVFAGYYQQQGRLDVASKLYLFRWITVLITFSAILLFNKNLILAAGISAGISILFVIGCIAATIPSFYQGDWKYDKRSALNLLITCFPVFLTNFLMFYISNAPKYTIDRCLSEHVQAYYGFISMPIFVMGLLSSFIYQPVLVNMSKQWKMGEYKGFITGMKRQYLLILVINVICVAGAYLLGIPVLSMLYGVDLSKYKLEFMLLIISGGFLAYAGYLMVIFTMMRLQIKLLVSFTLVSSLTVIFMKNAIKYRDILGAVIFHMSMVVLLTVILQIIFNHEYRKHGNSKNKNRTVKRLMKL